MDNKIPYSSYFKGNDDWKRFIPEYKIWFKENLDKLNHTNYRQYYKNASNHK